MNEKRAPILLFGHRGQVGWELRRTLAPLGEVVTAGLDGAQYPLDITDKAALHELVHRLRPCLMINAAAYTAVDEAESEQEQAYRVNAEAVGYIGELGAATDCPIVHYSTDYVFSGQGEKPWEVEDEPAPQSVYGKSKLAGEKALEASRADYIILRTAWVYGTRGKNFLLTMLRLFAERENLGVVDDQIGAPTWSRMIAEATAQILIQCRQPEGRFYFGTKSGIYHLTSRGQASWYEFAQAILERCPQNCRLHPIATSDYPTPATRPSFSVLDNSLVEEVFGIRLPDWRQSLDLCLEEITVQGD